MKPLIAAAALVILAGCSGDPQQPLPTQAQLPTGVAVTPTTENELNSTPENIIEDGISVQFTGARSGTFTNALLTVEAGQDYILLLEQPEEENPVQLRLILAGNIEPGTYVIVSASGFELPAGAAVAARFDLGFLAEEVTGTLVLETIGENRFSGTLELSAEAEEGNLDISGRFQNLNVVVIG